jgi:hypothetical protein
MSVHKAGGDLAAWCIVDNNPNWEGIEVWSLFGKDGIAKLASAMRAQAGAWGKMTVEAMTPPHPCALEALEAAGYRLELNPKHPEEVREHGADIFELWLNDDA